MAHVFCDAVCDATFHEVANNFNNNIVMLNKPYNITNKSGKIEYTCFADVLFFAIDPVLISICCTQIYVCCYFFSATELITPRIAVCMQGSIIAPRWKGCKNSNIREPS
jgi:hypothetical protein